MDESGNFRISKEQLLANTSEADGDELIISNLKLSKGEGTLRKNNDATWMFKPAKDWNGEVEFAFKSSDRSGPQNTGPQVIEDVYVPTHMDQCGICIDTNKKL